jgi:mono/diheme cytochrome c family protein
MKRFIPCIVAAMFVWLVFGSTGNIKADEYQQGKNLYTSNCLICHGVNGNGEGSAAATVTPKPADLTSPKFWQKNDYDKIADFIKYGHAMMPAIDFSSEQIKAIIDYISHAFKKDGKP